MLVGTLSKLLYFHLFLQTWIFVLEYFRFHEDELMDVFHTVLIAHLHFWRSWPVWEYDIPRFHTFFHCAHDTICLYNPWVTDVTLPTQSTPLCPHTLCLRRVNINFPFALNCCLREATDLLILTSSLCLYISLSLSLSLNFLPVLASK